MQLQNIKVFLLISETESIQWTVDSRDYETFVISKKEYEGKLSSAVSLLKFSTKEGEGRGHKSVIKRWDEKLEIEFPSLGNVLNLFSESDLGSFVVT